MNYPIYMKEKNIASQAPFNNAVKKIKIEDDGSSVIDEYSTVINEEKLRTGKGIIYALIFCIPFWFLFIAFVVLFS